MFTIYLSLSSKLTVSRVDSGVNSETNFFLADVAASIAFGSSRLM